MTPRARRILIPTIVIAIALGLVMIVVTSRRPPVTAARGPDAPAANEPTANDPAANDPTASDPAASDPAARDPDPAGANATSAPGTGGDDGEDVPGDAANDPATTPPPAPMTGLRAVAPATGVSGHDPPAASLGSLDPGEAPFLIEFSRAGAGIERITLSDVWETAADRRLATAHHKAVAAGASDPPPLPDASQRYVLREAQPLTNIARGAGFMVPTLATNQIVINGGFVNLFDYNRGADGEPTYIWAETGPGAFETTVVNEAGDAILRVRRQFVIGQNFDLTIEQRLDNLTDEPLEVEWSQYGPGSLPQDRSRYMDRRRYRFGHLVDPTGNRTIVLSNTTDLLFERTDVMKRAKKAAEAAVAGNKQEQAEYLTLWPNKFSREEGYELSWFGAVNRYFGLTVHPVLDENGQGEHALSGIVDRILIEVSTPDPAGTAGTEVIFTYLTSPHHTIPPGGTLPLDLGVYAGPLDRSILNHEEPYVALSMGQLILYQMSSFCAICTFQWLAHLLIGFLTLLRTYVVFDWGIAIICLVIVVRTILHPLTKRSQISMQRFGKVMGSMKPELDKLQKKFGHDPKKMQQEQMRLMREKGANPLQMLGCLPMFLQTPIWIALYAMLYFTFDLRQEPAFFGLFQKLTGGRWPFLADLSAGDHFLGEVAEPFKFFMWNVTGYNVLPILMGVIFFIQQKYMAPPPSPTMTPEQINQQKIMKVMMVVLFPLMLYSAPSGLTLYILTSSSIGILESRYIRRHIDEMDLEPKKKDAPTGGKPKRARDAQGRAYAEALKRMEEKKKRRKQGPRRTYKKRK